MLKIKTKKNCNNFQLGQLVFPLPFHTHTHILPSSEREEKT